MRQIFLLALALLCIATKAEAATNQNRVPSCYAANKIDVPQTPSDREIFILLDQTVELDDGLKQSLADSVRDVLKAGTSFTILRFSAFSQGRYLEIVTAGVLEKPVPENLRNSISVKALRSFDACLLGQRDFAVKMAFTGIGNTINQSSNDLAKSDVLGSLAETARLIKTSSAQRKVLLLVSDMLENSSISSFYLNNGVRKIDPVKELKLVESNHLFGDFDGAAVFVMGAGLISEPKNKSGGGGKESFKYRDPKTLIALKQFWTEYFSRSRATLEDFGTPSLLLPVR